MSSEEKEPYFDGPLIPNAGPFHPGLVQLAHNSLGQMPMQHQQQNMAPMPSFYNPNDFGAAAAVPVTAQAWNAPPITQMNGPSMAGDMPPQGAQSYFGGVDTGSASTSATSSQQTSPSHAPYQKTNDISYPVSSAEPQLYSPNTSSLFNPPNVQTTELYNPAVPGSYDFQNDVINQNSFLPPGGASGQHGYTHSQASNIFTPNTEFGNPGVQNYMNPVPHLNNTPPLSQNIPDIANTQPQTPEPPTNDYQYESSSPINPMDLHNGMPAQPRQDSSDQSYMNMAHNNTNYVGMPAQASNVNAYIDGEYHVHPSNGMMIPASSSGQDYDILHSQGTWKELHHFPEQDQSQIQFGGAEAGQAVIGQSEEDRLFDAAQRVGALNLEENVVLQTPKADSDLHDEAQGEQQMQEQAFGGAAAQPFIVQDNTQDSLHNFVSDNPEDLSTEPPPLEQIELKNSGNAKIYGALDPVNIPESGPVAFLEPKNEQMNPPFVEYGYGIVPPVTSSHNEAENHQSYMSQEEGASSASNIPIQPSVDSIAIPNTGEDTSGRANEANLEHSAVSNESPIPADGLHPKQADVLEPSAHTFASPTSAFDSRIRSQSTGSNNSNASSQRSANSQPNRNIQSHYLAGSSYMPVSVASVQATRQSSITTSNPFSTNTMHSSHVGDRGNSPPTSSASAFVQPIPAIPDIVRPLPSEIGGENLRTGATVPLSSNQSLHSQVLHNRMYSSEPPTVSLPAVVSTTRSQPDVVQSPPEVASALLHPPVENARTVMALKTNDIPEASGPTPISVPASQPISVNSDPYLSRSLYNAHSDPPPTTSAINPPMSAANTQEPVPEQTLERRNELSDEPAPVSHHREDDPHRDSSGRSIPHHSESRRQDDDSNYYGERYDDRRDPRWDDHHRSRNDEYGKRDYYREDSRYRRDDRYDDHTPRSRNEQRPSRPSSRHGDPASYSRPYDDRNYGRDHHDSYYNRDQYYDDRYRDYDRRDPYYSRYDDRRRDRYYDQQNQRYSDAWHGHDHRQYSDQYYDQYYYDYYREQRHAAGDEDARSVYSERSRATEHEPVAEQEWNQRHSYAERSQYDYGYSREGNDQRYYEDSLMDESTLSNTYEDSWQRLPQVPARQTPAKFSMAHTIVRFGPGGHLIKVLPNRPTDNQPSTVEIHSVEILLQDTEEAEHLRSYTGPLSKKETHKNDVLQFAAARSSESMKDMSLLDRRSTALVWDFLALLVRQNGSVEGTDIAELLTKDHTGDFKLLQSPLEASRQRQLQLQQRTATPNSLPDEQGGSIASPVPDQEESVASTYSMEISTMTERNCNRFRELLLHGRIKDALEWAMKSGLWGHALLLASKTDSRMHAKVMLRFANSLPINDPLQTVYQLMSGRQPAAATCVSEEGWGDWRPHLAMILSNPTANPSLDMRAVLTMGDTLSSRGLLHAAHFCYLMASSPLGYYGRPTSKMVLLGANHTLSFDEFATLDSVRRTEIYEYAILLGKSQQSDSGSAPSALPAFQLYKFMYACKLAEYGMNAQAFHYCERIAKSVCRSPTAYSTTLVNQLLNISDQLCYHDPQIQIGMMDVRSLRWLEALRNINSQIQAGIVLRPNAPASLTISNTPVISTTPTTEDDDIRFSAHTPSQDEAEDVMDSGAPLNSYHLDQPPMTNQQYGQSQFAQQDQQRQQQVNMFSVPAQEPGQPAMMVPNAGMQQQHTQNYSQEPPQVPHDQGIQQPNYHHPQQFMQPSALPYQQPAPAAPGFDQLANQANPLAPGYSNFQPTQQPPLQNQNSYGFNPEQTQHPNVPVENSERNEQVDYYDYMTQPHKAHHGKGVSPRSRTISQSSQRSRASTLKGYDRNTPTMMGRRSRTTSENSAGRRSRKTSGEQNHQSKSKEGNEEVKKSGSWSLFGWFNRNKKGQVHLPDDKEKEIFWDNDKQRWVDKNATEEDMAPPAPPPMDNVHTNPAPQMQQPQQLNTNQNQNQMNNQPALAPTPEDAELEFIGGIAPPRTSSPKRVTGDPKLTANRFSLKNLGGNRSMYKNAFSSSSTPMVAPPAPIDPLMPGMQNTNLPKPTGFMIPNAAPAAVSQPNEEPSPAASSTPLHPNNNQNTDQQNIQMFTPGNTPHGSSTDFRQPFNHGGSENSLRELSVVPDEPRDFQSQAQSNNSYAPQQNHFSEKDHSNAAGPTMFFNPSQFTAPPDLATQPSGRDNALTRRARGKGYPGRR